MSNLRIKIYRDTQKQRDEYRRTGAWLNNAAPFQHDIRLPKDVLQHVQQILENCNINKRLENKLNFEILMANLMKNRLRRSVMVSLNRNDWRKNRYKVVGPGIIPIIHKLHDKGFIYLKEGYQNSKTSRVSRIWPTKVLISYFSESSQQVVYHPPELVFLRDERKRDIEYKDTDYTRRVRTILWGINEINKIADIRFGKYRLSGSLVAIYKYDFSLYGRLHTRGSFIHYQSLSGEERREITINGDSIVELDFSGLHPHLLYAKEGIQYDEDPYAVIDERKEVRPFLKHILLSLINAKDENTALKSASKWYFNHHKEREILKELGISKIKPLIEKIKEVHSPISHYFCCSDSTGLRVMNLDARIALDIVHYFALKQIPILAIHDSFIVQKQYEQELYTIMQNVYSRHTKGFRIEIKKKG